MTNPTPTDWKQIKLGEITSKISDGLHSTPKYVEQSTYYFINGNNLINDKIVIGENTKCVNQDEYRKHKKDLNNSTILLSINGTIGNVAYYKSEKVVLGKSAAYINCNAQVKKEFIFYLLKSSKTKRDFDGELTGSTIKNLSLKSIKNKKLLLPPLPEQHRIVAVLEIWDKTLETLTQKIEFKKNIKKGLMQELLTGKRRLPGFSGEWETVKLEDICEIKKGQGLSKSKLSKEGIFKCMLYGEIYTTYSEVIDEVRSKTNYEEGIKSMKWDILIPASTTTSALDLATATTIQEEDVLLGGDINIIRAKKKNVINGVFMSYYLTHVKKHELARLAQGVTIIHLYGKDFKKIKLKLPEKEEQTAIAQILTTADNEITALENKKQILENQKKYLLNNLITGKIRTPQNLTMPK